VSVALTFVVLRKFDNLLNIHVNIIFGHMTKSLLSLLKLLGIEFYWEFDLEEDKEVSVLVGLLVEWETFIFNSLDLVGFNDLSRIVLDSEF